MQRSFCLAAEVRLRPAFRWRAMRTMPSKRKKLGPVGSGGPAFSGNPVGRRDAHVFRITIALTDFEAASGHSIQVANRSINGFVGARSTPSFRRNLRAPALLGHRYERPFAGSRTC